MTATTTRVWIAVGLLVVGFLIGWSWQGSRWESRYTDLELSHSRASEKAVSEALAEQQRRYESMESVSDEGEKTIDSVRADSTDADPSADRLREELAAIRARTTRELSSAATQRATDRQTIMVLSELYEGADQRARELGAALDESHARGLTCEAAYAAVCGN